MQVAVSPSLWRREEGTKSPESSRAAEREYGSDLGIPCGRKPAGPAASCGGHGATLDSHLYEALPMSLWIKFVEVCRIVVKLKSMGKDKWCT